MISLKQLSYALAIEKNLHFRKAAEYCHVSQSALSTAINELEKQLGLQIFERSNKKVLVTPVGQEVLKRAHNIMLEVKDLEHFSDDKKKPLDFPITIGAIPTIAPYLLPKTLPILYRLFPEIKINAIEERSDVLVDLVKSGKIDTAILALPYPCDGLLTLELLQENFYWVGLKNKENEGKTVVANNEIDHSKLMLLEDGHCLKDHMLAICKSSEKINNQGFGATSLTTLIEMVLGDIGTTLIPAMALDQLTSKNDQLSAIPLEEPGPHRRIAFIIRPNYSRLSCVEALIDACKLALSGPKRTKETSPESAHVA